MLTLDQSALLADPALAAADPRLESLVNVNTPAEYQEARARRAPMVQVQCFGALATSVDPGPRTVRAATLRAAASRGRASRSTGRRSPWSRRLPTGAATHSTSDPELPLLAGDIVAFLPSGRALLS